MLSENFLNFLNSCEPDLNTVGKRITQAESKSGRLFLHHRDKMIENQTYNMITASPKVKNPVIAFTAA